MAEARDCAGEAFDDMNPRRSLGWRHAEYADQQGVADHPEGHAQRAIDQLCGKTDSDEREQCRQIESHEFHRGALPELSRSKL